MRLDNGHITIGIVNPLAKPITKFYWPPIGHQIAMIYKSWFLLFKKTLSRDSFWLQQEGASCFEHLLLIKLGTSKGSACPCHRKTLIICLHLSRSPESHYLMCSWCCLVRLQRELNVQINCQSFNR